MAEPRRPRGYLTIVEAELRAIRRAALDLSADGVHVRPLDMYHVLEHAERALKALGVVIPRQP